MYREWAGRDSTTWSASLSADTRASGVTMIGDGEGRGRSRSRGRRHRRGDGAGLRLFNTGVDFASRQTHPQGGKDAHPVGESGRMNTSKLRHGVKGTMVEATVYPVLSSAKLRAEDATIGLT